MLTMRLPQALGFVFPPPDELPEADPRFVWTLRRLGNEPATSALAMIPDDERDALMCSLATTITRSRYCIERFERTVGLLAERRKVAGTLHFDTSAKSALFEATAALAAIRSVVDELFWVAARRAGKTPDEAAGWKLETALRCDLTQPATRIYDVPEVRLLRTRVEWYDRLNKYRNALTHWGWRLQIGAFFPVGDTSAEANDPKLNVMFVPDYASLGRARRSHEWTYNERTRVEALLEAAWAGLVEWVTEVTALWGGTPTPEGKMPPERRPHVIILAPCPVLVAQAEVLAPTFSSADRARAFHEAMFRSEASFDVCEVHQTSLPYPGAANPCFWLALPAGRELADLLATIPQGMARDDVTLGIDPVVEPGTGRIVACETLRHFPAKELIEADDTMAHVSVPVTTERSRLFVVRRRPGA